MTRLDLLREDVRQKEQAVRHAERLMNEYARNYHNSKVILEQASERLREAEQLEQAEAR